MHGDVDVFRVLCVDVCRSMYMNRWFNYVSLFMTVYALFADDLRLSATPKQADNVFNAFTLLAIVVFMSEVITFSFGMDDYFNGFFFWLDLLSTVTLALDLTWLTDIVYCGSAALAGAASKTAETTLAGRAGARASRTLRVIRLIRMAKGYKWYKMMMLRKNDTDGIDARGLAVPGEEEDFDGVHDTASVNNLDVNRNASLQQAPGETRVGKKLSDMTTRRVIILVLVMLIVMPVFQTSFHGMPDLEASVRVAAEVIYARWVVWCGFNTATTALPPCLDFLAQQIESGGAMTAEHTAWLDSQRKYRWFYEKFLLDFVHQHHGSAAQSADEVFWWGMRSSSLAARVGEDQALAGMGEIARLMQATYLGDYALQPDEWDAVWARSEWLSDGRVDTLDDNAKERLMAPWTEICDIRGDEYVGVPLVDSWDGSAGSTGCALTEELRCSEWVQYMPRTRTDEQEGWTDMTIVLNLQPVISMESMLNALQTMFICISVWVGSMFFAKDARELLLQPIQRMIDKMQNIKDNPLEAMRLGDLEYRRSQKETERQEEKLAKMSGIWRLCAYLQTKSVKEPIETVILEKTIIKVGSLLAVGFGEASADIIGENMKVNRTSGPDLALPGQQVDCVIGFCGIKDFILATETLKEDVVLFVNLISEIVHGCVDEFGGSPNKNMGDSFLLIWRMSDLAKAHQAKLADMSLVALAKVIAEISKSPKLANYHSRVRLCFGLHAGWAIVGVIGSNYKIDASYLSPNVNTAVTLESVASLYGVSILMSDVMVSHFSKEMGQTTRLIDHVKFRGSKSPMRIHTFDAEDRQLQCLSLPADQTVKNRFKWRKQREIRKNAKWSDEYRIVDLFESDRDLHLMRAPFSREFFKRFATAYRNYEAGQWLVARDMLFTCHYTPATSVGPPVLDAAQWPKDGPTRSLLRFMQGFDFVPPDDWPGHRHFKAAIDAAVAHAQDQGLLQVKPQRSANKNPFMKRTAVCVFSTTLT